MLPNLKDIKSVLFDLDGTLINTLPGLTQLTNQVRADFGKPPLSEETLSNFVGKGISSLIHRTMDDDQSAPMTEEHYKKVLESVMTHLKQGEYNEGEAYPGVKDALERLRQAGFKIAVVTNKIYSMTVSGLKATGLFELIDLIIGADTVPNNKPLPDPLLVACERLQVSPCEAIMVGDSGNDSQAALAAGIGCFLVRTGWSEGISLEEIAKRDNVIAILDSVVDVANLLINSKTSI